MAQTGCLDPCRFLFPQKIEFSYFSHVRSSYSRIDYLYIDKTLLPSLEKNSILCHYNIGSRPTTFRFTIYSLQ